VVEAVAVVPVVAVVVPVVLVGLAVVVLVAHPPETGLPELLTQEAAVAVVVTLLLEMAVLEALV
jgi:hypothetical protein